ncbi:hypothetical protein KDL01_32120 [Actinospica durhamensis]|uniref:Uncharacterized protein n=1 Tax=Actinospica durhamensis TaxID=1508375 RepID=A0A941EX08_9ACTN|nr:hypothetical protein [Actinospica durhamensis]MBR7837963.1 hypothetical protein [Actinospica durhamensis]
MLEVVRYVNEAGQYPGNQEALKDDEPTRPPGWHLGRDVPGSLEATGAVIDIDIDEHEEGS